MIIVETTKDIPESFPKLMISTETNTIVLFFEPGVGTCLCDPHKPSRVGEYSSTWRMEIFKDYNGTIALKNK